LELRISAAPTGGRGLIVRQASLSMQAATKAELLENELDVMGAESTEDRLSGAAQLLQLTQRCEDLKMELAAARAGLPQVSHSLCARLFLVYFEAIYATLENLGVLPPGDYEAS